MVGVYGLAQDKSWKKCDLVDTLSPSLPIVGDGNAELLGLKFSLAKISGWVLFFSFYF